MLVFPTVVDGRRSGGDEGLGSRLVKSQANTLADQKCNLSRLWSIARELCGFKSQRHSSVSPLLDQSKNLLLDDKEKTNLLNDVSINQNTSLLGRHLSKKRLPLIVYRTDISSEHSLRTCTQVRRNVRKSDAVYACKKKNATEVTVSGIHDLTLRRGDFIAARGPPMWSRLFLPKESSHKFAVVFVKVMHF